MINIKKLAEYDLDDFINVVRVFEHVFEMQDFVLPSHDHLKALLQKDDFIVFAAFDGYKVIAGLTGYVLQQYYSEKPLAYIYDLAVEANYQRQGIGSKLISEMNAHCQSLGCEEVFVQADKVDDYALDFYRSTRPTEEEQVVHFYYTLQEGDR
jgi:aminoglycoside 3-N-acetyltransferase I